MPGRFNDAVDEEPIFETISQFSGGMDEFSTPTELPANVSQRFVNMLQDLSGKARTRAGADPLGAVLSAGQRVQCLTYFDIPGTERLYAAINASLRSWDGATWSTVGAYPFGANTIQMMFQGNNLLYCSSGVGQWQSYNGAAWTALGTGAGNPPVGATLACWHTERPFAAGDAANPDTLYIGDIAGGGAGTWNNSIRIGRGEGQAITAITTFKGEWLFVGKGGSAYVVITDPTIAVANWEVLRIADKVGVVAAPVAMLDTVFFLSSDGIRAMAPTDSPDYPFEVQPPISQPMQPYIDRINWSVARKSVGWRYKEFIYFSVPLDSATEPNYTLVLNTRTQAWMGYWSGWTPTCATITQFQDVDRMVFGDSLGFVNQWKDYLAEGDASRHTDNGVEVPWLLRTRATNVGEPSNFKDPTWAQVRFVDSSLNVRIRIYLDGIEARTFDRSLIKVQNQLPVNLPFNLAQNLPSDQPMALDALREFKEAFMEIEGSGRVVIRSASFAAFMNTHDDE